jgi:5-methylcytosine-specific restriction endonuclease McrA
MDDHYWCGKELAPDEATVEHIVRRADGGGNRLRNIAITCARFNSGRHDGAEPCQNPDGKAGFRNKAEWLRHEAAKRQRKPL